jgi:hypothetical protein
MIKKFHTKTIFSILISISLVFVAFLVTPTATGMTTTTIYVEPQSIIMRMEENFSVNITIANVADLCGWDFRLYYSNSVLNGTDITEGSFLKTGRNTYFYVANFTDTYNATHGLIRAVCTLFEPTGVNGGGDLAKIGFKAKGTGETSLKLADTIIVDSAFPPNEIPHVADDGLVRIAKFGDFGSPVNYVPTFFVFDGEVEGFDLALFIHCYKELAPSEAMRLADLGSPVNYIPTFFAFDGVIDGYDLALFTACYKELGP